MKANEGNGRNPEHCKKIARSLNCASDRSDPKLAQRGEQKKDDKSRKARPKGLPRSYIGYWKGALRVCPVTGNFFVQIFYDRQRGRFTFERNEDIAAEKARKIFLTIQKDGWEVARERYAQTAATRFRNRKEKTRVIALEGRIDDPTIGDLLRVAKEASEVRPGTFHRYEADLRFIVSQVFSVPHTKEVPVPAKKRGKRGNREAAVRSKLRPSESGVAPARRTRFIFISARRPWVQRCPICFKETFATLPRMSRTAKHLARGSVND